MSQIQRQFQCPLTSLRVRAATLVAALSVLMMVGGCHEATGHGTSIAKMEQLTGQPPFAVTCTVGMLADIVNQVGGERLEVQSLMGPGTDPHLYTTTPGDRRKLRDADSVLYCGHHLEGKMVDVLERMASSKPTFGVCEKVDSSKLRTLSNAVDPHLWFNVSIWSECTGFVRDFLTEIDPAGREEYQTNAMKYQQELETLEAYVRKRLEEIPATRRVMVTAHDAFGYFGDAYGIEVLAIQGMSTESEAAVSKINELVKIIVERQIPAVFVESTISEKNIMSLIEGCKARGHDLKIGGSLYSDAMGAADSPAGTYIGMVRHNVDTIVEALK